MNKDRWTYLHLLLKVSWLAYVVLFFVCGETRGSIVTTFAMSSNPGLTLPVLPISLLNSTPPPTATPASLPSPSPTSISPQPPPARQDPMPIEQPVLPLPAATAPIVPTSSPVRVTAPASKIMILPPFLTHPFLPGGKDMNTFTLSLTLGVGTPLLLIIAVTLWLLVRWQIKMFTAPSNVGSRHRLKSDSPPLSIDSTNPTSAREPK